MSKLVLFAVTTLSPNVLSLFLSELVWQFSLLNRFDRKVFTFCEEKINTKLLSCAAKDCDRQDHAIFVDQQSSKRHLGRFPRSTASKGISKEVELQHGETSKWW